MFVVVLTIIALRSCSVSAVAVLAVDGCPTSGTAWTTVCLAVNASLLESERPSTRCCSDVNESCESYCTSDYPDIGGHSVSFANASAICESQGRRLCTPDELLVRRKCCGTGCQFDSERVWTLEICDELEPVYTPTPQTAPPTPTPTAWPAAAPMASYFTVDGCVLSLSGPVPLCVEATVQASELPENRLPVTRCCSDVESSCESYCDEGREVSWAQADAVCKSHARRLCTAYELLKLKQCCSTGCGYDAHRVWTRERCGATTTSTIVCQDGVVDLQCFDNEVIKVLSAVWGRRESSLCPREIGTEDDTSCALDVLDFVSNCDNQRSCSFGATNEVLDNPNPCDGTSKYLEVEWTCECLGRLHHTKISEGTNASLWCSDNEVISIDNAQYLSLSSPSCGRDMPGYEQRVPLSRRCDGLTLCEFAVSNQVMGGDPCFGDVKTLSVTWRCSSIDSCEVAVPVPEQVDCLEAVQIPSSLIIGEPVLLDGRYDASLGIPESDLPAILQFELTVPTHVCAVGMVTDWWIKIPFGEIYFRPEGDTEFYFGGEYVATNTGEMPPLVTPLEQNIFEVESIPPGVRVEAIEVRVFGGEQFPILLMEIVIFDECCNIFDIPRLQDAGDRTAPLTESFVATLLGAVLGTGAALFGAFCCYQRALRKRYQPLAQQGVGPAELAHLAS